MEYILTQDTFPSKQQEWREHAVKVGNEKQCERVITMVAGFFTRFPAEELRVIETSGVRSILANSAGLLISKMNI